MKWEIDEIKKIKVNPGEAIIISYDEDKITQDEFLCMLDILSEVFPENNIVMKPNHINLEVMGDFPSDTIN